MSLQIGEILEAFPDEAKELVPKCRVRLRRELALWFIEAKRIQKKWWPQDHIYIALAVLDHEKPKAKFHHLGQLEKMERIMKMPKEQQLTEQDIEQARTVPIFGLHTWQGLKGRPEKFMARCCFHEDKSASMGVTGSLFNCFGCGAKGDVIHFVQKMNGLSFPQAVEYLCKK